MSKPIDLDTSWLEPLQSEFDASYMQQLRTFLTDEIDNKKTILPKPSLWFNALNPHDLKMSK